MSPPPVPARPPGPMRLVLSAYPSPRAAEAAVRGALTRKLVACASVLSVRSRYWWKGRLEAADESLVLFKTVPKRVGALFDYLAASHPYDVPEVAEVDVGRVAPGYLSYLVTTLDPSSLEPPERPVRRPEGPRARGARGPGRTRAPHHRRSR
jgi:periplasmic divalent cation tolerance protein